MTNRSLNLDQHFFFVSLPGSS